VQSNHVRQTIAAGARFGLKSEIILEERTGSKASDYVGNGNVLLDRLMGASIRFVPGGTDMAPSWKLGGEAVRQRGGKPYVIPAAARTRSGPWAMSTARASWWCRPTSWT
jgi:L-cysteate sulfo-lyase